MVIVLTLKEHITVIVYLLIDTVHLKPFYCLLSDFRHTITVQHSGKSRNPSSPNSPPGSPSITRLRAIARKLINML